MTEKSTPCPCGSGKSFDQCCEPCLSGKQAATTAEALMRSRYTAYVVGDTEYLLATWHPSTRPSTLELFKDLKWQSLKIKSTSKGQTNDNNGTVEFIADSKTDGKAHRLHENSSFVYENNQWFYLEGKILCK